MPALDSFTPKATHVVVDAPADVVIDHPSHLPTSPPATRASAVSTHQVSCLIRGTGSLEV